MTANPIDSLKFITARAEDLLEYIEDQVAVTHEDQELATLAHALQQEIAQAACQHLGDQPMVYSDGVAVRTELRSGGVVHVRFPSHPAKGVSA